MKAIYSKSAPEPIGPYSQAIEAGGLIFISGQLGIDAGTGDLVEGSIGDETRVAIDNISAILKECGLDLGDVVKVTVYLRNTGDFEEMNEVYGEYFSSFEPAREVVEVGGLPRGAGVEISAIAFRE